MTSPRFIKSHRGPIAAIDIGSTKTTCLIATVEDDGELQINGIGLQRSRGLRAGAVVDMDAARDCIVQTVQAAEHLAGETIRGVVVNLSGGRPRSRTFAIAVSIAGHEVAQGDVRRVLEQGDQFHNDPDKELIHKIPIGFRIDDNRGIVDPRGMCGERLGVDMHVITASAGPVRNLATCVAGCHLTVDAFVVSPYASGLACLVEDEMDLGVTLIDMGGGTTSIAVFDDGEIIFTDTVPIGGSAVTMDIAHGLSTPLSAAERMKIKFGRAIAAPDDTEALIDVPRMGEAEHAAPNHVSRSVLNGIIQPRMEEIFELVQKRLEAGGVDHGVGRRAVLTGGASQMPACAELAESILDKKVRLARPHRLDGLAESASGPAFATCAGLLRYARQAYGSRALAALAEDKENRGMLSRIGNWLNDNF